MNTDGKKLNDFYTWKMALIAIIGAEICHLRFLISNSFGIDTECRMQGIDAYLVQGRPGIHWLRSIFGTESFNLYFVRTLTFVMLLMTCWAFLILFDYYNCGYRLRIAGVLFCLIWVASPFWTSQIYFLGQSVEVLFSILITPLIVIMVSTGIERFKTRFYLIALAVGLTLFVFSTYQVNLVVYAICVCSVYLIKLQNEKEWPVKKQLLWLIAQVGVFLAGAIIYIVIAKRFYMSDAGYLYSQIAWTKNDTMTCIRNIWNVVKSSILGREFHGFIYVPACISVFVISVVNDVKNKNIKGKVLKYLALLFLFASPYIFTIFYGSSVPPRMNYPFPIATAAVLYHLFIQLKILFANKKHRLIETILYIVISSFVLIDFGSHAQIINTLYYTDDYRFNKETEIAKNLYYDIQEFVSESDFSEEEIYSKLIYIGTADIKYNSACAIGYDVIGYSNLNWDSSIMMGRNRIYYFMKDCGYELGEDVTYFTKEEQDFYYSYFADIFGAEIDMMPSYPTNGYIQQVSDEETGAIYIVVKLGDDWRDLYENAKAVNGY